MKTMKLCYGLVILAVRLKMVALRHSHQVQKIHII